MKQKSGLMPMVPHQCPARSENGSSVSQIECELNEVNRILTVREREKLTAY